MASTVKKLRCPAIEIRQGPKRVLYSFAVDGKDLPSFAAVSRLGREKNTKIRGYQRPEVLAHIGEIRRYLESANPMIPNALVVAFDNRVKFKPDKNGTKQNVFSRSGVLEIPIDKNLPDSNKPGWLVDGQQRMAAIREAEIDSFPVLVTAFITKKEEEQRSQFILVNSTKPLPKGLIYELLPATNGAMPSLLQRKRFPAYLSERLNFDEDSPFHGLIKTPTNGEGVVKDNSILKMLENSLSDGALYQYRDPKTGEGNAEAMLVLLKEFWTAARLVFADAWGVSPRVSRLMHGAGIVSLGFVMDASIDRHRRKKNPTVKQFETDLVPLKEVCRWTNGYWDFGPGLQRKWNELQNTSKDIQLLANYLLIEYKNRVWNRYNETLTR